jgi:hypothetical protein
MLERFAELPDGASVWTRTGDGMLQLGRLTGPWRYDDSAAARVVGIHHVRPTRRLKRPFAPHEVPAAVTNTFARGARNLQRTHDAHAERLTGAIWDAETNSPTNPPSAAPSSTTLESIFGGYAASTPTLEGTRDG